MAKKIHIGLYITFLLAVCFGIVIAFNYKYLLIQIYGKKTPESKLYDDIIKRAAKHYTIDPCLVKAVIWKESGFNAEAVGSKGEIGLMQIRPETAAADWSREKKIKIPCQGLLFCPELNIEIGTWYLAKALKYWRDKRKKSCQAIALCEYNAGRSNVRKWLLNTLDDTADIIRNIPYPHTKIYVTSILKKYKQYKLRRSEYE